MTKQKTPKTCRTVQKIKSGSHHFTCLIKVCKVCIQELKFYWLCFKHCETASKFLYKLLVRPCKPDITLKKKIDFPSTTLSTLVSQSILRTNDEIFLEGKLKS